MAKMLSACVVALFLTSGLPVLPSMGQGAAVEHGGGLDAQGCHTNHKTGEYHCHRKP